MVVHGGTCLCSQHPRGRGSWVSFEFEDSLVFKECFRLAMATQYDPDSKIKTKTKNKNFKQKEVKLRGYFEVSYNI